MSTTAGAQLPHIVYRLGDYESPLAYFRAFRLSPHFRLMTGCKISDLTFSNNIDAQKLLCKFDVGGVCNDQQCAYQHWRDMPMSAEQLVRQLMAYVGARDEQFADILSDAQRGGGDSDTLARRTVARIAQLDAQAEPGEERAVGHDDSMIGSSGIVWRARKRR